MFFDGERFVCGVDLEKFFMVVRYFYWLKVIFGFLFCSIKDIIFGLLIYIVSDYGVYSFVYCFFEYEISGRN